MEDYRDDALGDPYYIYDENGINLLGIHFDQEIFSKLYGENQQVVEPMTTSVVAIWIAKNIAEGVVSKIGGDMLSKILGDPSMDDIAKIIRQAIEEIKGFVREEMKRQLQELEIRRMESHLTSVKYSLERFSDAVSTEEQNQAMFLLQDALTKLQDVRALSQQHGLTSSWIYQNAVSFELLTLSALYTSQKRSFWLKAVRRLISEAKLYLFGNLRPQFYASWGNPRRLGSVRAVQVRGGFSSELLLERDPPDPSGPAREGPQYRKVWIFSLDNKNIGPYPTEKAAKDARALRWEEIVADAQRRTSIFFKPALLATESWEVVDSQAEAILTGSRMGEVE